MDPLPGLRPVVVLMDICMPVLDGIATTARMRARPEPLVVLVLVGGAFSYRAFSKLAQLAASPAERFTVCTNEQ